MGTEDRTIDRVSRGLLLLTLLGFAGRVLFLLLVPSCPPTGDEPGWLAIGLRELGRPNRGLSPFRTHILFWPPLYPYLIAILHRVFGSVQAVLWAQVVLGTLLIPAIGRVGRLALGRRVGLLAAAFTAFYPELLWYPAHYWSETLYLTLLWWAIERTLAAQAAGSWRRAAAAGILWGLSSLTRELSLYLVPVAALWLCIGPIAAIWRARRPSVGATRSGGTPDLAIARRSWAPAAALLLGTMLVVAPWTVRNAIVFHAFVPVSTMAGPPLWQGNARVTHLYINEVLAAKGGPIEAERYARAMAWQAILARQPFWIFEKLAEEMPEFWKAGSEVLDHLVGRAACGRLSRGRIIELEVVFVGPYLVLLGMALPGLARLRLREGPLLLLALVAAYNAAHVVALASTRYRLPVVPALFLLAAATLAGGRDGALHPASAKRWLVLAALVVLALVVLAPGMEELESWRWLIGAATG